MPPMPSSSGLKNATADGLREALFLLRATAKMSDAGENDILVISAAAELKLSVFVHRLVSISQIFIVLSSEAFLRIRIFG